MRSCNRQDTPARPCCDGCAASLLMACSSRPTVVGRIRQMAKAKRSCRSRSTGQIAATLSSRGTLISHTSIRRALHSKVSSPLSNLRCRCSGMATSSGDCASRLSRNNVIGDVVCLLMRSHCNPRPNCRNDVIWTDDPSTIEPIVRVAHSVCLHQRLRCILCIGQIASVRFFLRILLHRSTSRFLNPLCCQQREIGFLADTGPISKTAIQSTLQN